MSRSRQFSYGAINIRVHTKHEPDEYIALWRKLFALRLVITRGAYGLMLGESRWLNHNQELGLIFGYLYSFVQIDPNDPWFNIKQKRPAEIEEVDQVNIPEGLKPNLKSVPYIFDVKRHQLFFLVDGPDGGVGAHQVHKLLVELCKRSVVMDRFGKVDLTVMTDHAQVASMLSWPVIRRLEITLERPNPTDYEDELEVLEQFNSRGVAKEHRIYVKASGAPTIAPDDQMRRVAGIAANNGLVVVKGVNQEGASGTAESKNFPMLMKAKYTPAVQTLVDAFVESVRDKFSKR